MAPQPNQNTIVNRNHYYLACTFYVCVAINCGAALQGLKTIFMACGHYVTY